MKSQQIRVNLKESKASAGVVSQSLRLGLRSRGTSCGRRRLRTCADARRAAGEERFS